MKRSSHGAQPGGEDPIFMARHACRSYPLHGAVRICPSPLSQNRMPRVAPSLLITPLLQQDRVCVGLHGEMKDDIIHALVDLLEGHEGIRDLEAVRTAVFARERVMSTGVGKGLALPHAKTEGVEGMVAALAIVENDIDFEALDHQPVRIVFLLAGTPAAKAQHVRILSRISRLINEDAFRERLLAAPDADTALQLIEEGEMALIESS